MADVLWNWFVRRKAWKRRNSWENKKSRLLGNRICWENRKSEFWRCQIGWSLGKRRAWRHRIGRRYGRKKHDRMLSRMLAAALIAEAGYMMVIGVNRMDIRLIRRDERYQAEWIPFWESADCIRDAENPGKIYGIRICPETLEIQFYSRHRSIKNH